MNTKQVLLNCGLRMPAIGLGTWSLTDQAVVDAVIPAALSAGYSYLDSAADYENEEQLGRVVQRLGRDNFFLLSKVWCCDHSNVERGIRRSLKLWNLPHMDMYLIHFPFNFVAVDDEHPTTSRMDSDGRAILDDSVTLEEVWQQMERLVDAGLTKSIGVSNFNISRLQRILAIARIKPAVNQVEMHPYLKQKALRTFCSDQSIQVIAYSPLGAGEIPILQDEVIQRVAMESGQTPAQVCLAWVSNHKAIPIPRTTNLDRLQENISFKPLCESHMRLIDGIPIENCRTCDPMAWAKVTCFETD